METGFAEAESRPSLRPPSLLLGRQSSRAADSFHLSNAACQGPGALHALDGRAKVGERQAPQGVVGKPAPRPGGVLRGS